jgi:hypothetical protein
MPCPGDMCDGLQPRCSITMMMMATITDRIRRETGRVSMSTSRPTLPSPRLNAVSVNPCLALGGSFQTPMLCENECVLVTPDHRSPSGLSQCCPNILPQSARPALVARRAESAWLAPTPLVALAQLARHVVQVRMHMLALLQVPPAVSRADN